MAYDAALADRLRKALGAALEEEKKMFGGVAFMVRGHMCIGVVKDEICARVGPEHFEALLSEPGARVMDFTHRPMKGWLFVDADGYDNDARLKAWVERCLAFNATLPSK